MGAATLFIVERENGLWCADGYVDVNGIDWREFAGCYPNFGDAVEAGVKALLNNPHVPLKARDIDVIVHGVAFRLREKDWEDLR